MNDIQKDLFVKLAVARFKAVLREHGMHEGDIKLAFSIPKSLMNFASKAKKGIGDFAGGFKPSAQMAGLKAAPGEFKKGLSTTSGKIFAPLTALGVHDAATRKRQKGSGFFESVGSRAGSLAGEAMIYAPGAAGMASWVLPYEGAGRMAGRAVDKGISATRAAGRGIRGMFGGGKTYKQKKAKFLKARAKSKEVEGKKYKVRSNY